MLSDDVSEVSWKRVAPYDKSKIPSLLRPSPSLGPSPRLTPSDNLILTHRRGQGEAYHWMNGVMMHGIRQQHKPRKMIAGRILRARLG